MKSLKSLMLAAVSAAALLGLGLPQADAGGKPIFEPPYEVDIFVRGSFNAWSLGHEMKFDAAANQYVAYIELTTFGDYFKIASEDFATVDLGYADDGYVELGVPEPVQQVAFNDLFLQVATPGVYSFTLDVSDPSNLTLLVAYARRGGDGAEQYTNVEPITDVPYFFDCLGAASPLVADISVRGTLHARQTPAGGEIYHDNQRVDGTGFDQFDREYRMHLTSPLIFNGMPNGSLTFSTGARGIFQPLADGPVLYIKYLYKLTIGPDGVVKREFEFYEDGCHE
jgi:hypothetical protein